MSHDRRLFLAAGLGVLASTRLAHAQAAAWSDAERANVQLVADFCASWSTRAGRASSSHPASPRSGVTERLGSWMPSSDRGIEFKILETFAAGSIVMNRRIDSFRSTTRPLTWEGVGVFFIKDAKIKEWSDYTIRVAR